MKELKIMLLLILLWIIGGYAFGQNKNQELKIGDQVPDIEFTKLYNTKQQSIKLSDYRGKLVILDFWATWCAPCVKALPKFDSLQKQFGDKLVILPITAERKETIDIMMSRMPEIKRLPLKYAYSTSLTSYFPFRLLPHEVWIDGTGKVIAITDDKDINSENIKKYLSGSKMTTLLKSDIQQDEDKPLIGGRFKNFQFRMDQIKLSSVITTGITGVSTVRQYYDLLDKGRNYIHIKTNNCLVQDLYKTALINPTFPGPGDKTYFLNKEFYLMRMSRLIWEASDTTYRSFSTSDTRRLSTLPIEEKAFSYELIAPLSDSLRYKSYILQDLNRYFGSQFGFIGVREKRMVKCYALSIIGKESDFKSKGGKSRMRLTRGQKGMTLENIHLDEWLFWYLSFGLPHFFSTPVINETNYSGKVDIDWGNDIDITDFESVNEGLRKHGLEFKLVYRDLDMIVFKNVK